MGGGGSPVFEGDVRTFGDVQGDAGDILGNLETALGGSLSEVFGTGEGGVFRSSQDLFNQALTGDLSGTSFFTNALNSVLQQGSISQEAIQADAFRRGGGRPQFGTDVLAAQDISSTRQRVASIGPELAFDLIRSLTPVLDTGVRAASGASGAFLGTQAAAQALSPEEQAVITSLGAQGSGGGKDSTGAVAATSLLGAIIGAA